MRDILFPGCDPRRCLGVGPRHLPPNCAPNRVPEEEDVRESAGVGASALVTIGESAIDFDIISVEDKFKFQYQRGYNCSIISLLSVISIFCWRQFHICQDLEEKKSAENWKSFCKRRANFLLIWIQDCNLLFFSASPSQSSHLTVPRRDFVVAELRIKKEDQSYSRSEPIFQSAA